MRIVSDESHISLRTKIGERAPFVGLAVLAVATVLIFVRPQWLWLTMALVWVGFLISLTGSYLGDRYVGPLAHHKRVPDALKGLGDEYTLIMYELSVPFTLVEPGGITVLTVKSQGGQVVYEKGHWRHRQRLGFLRRFAGQEGLGRPHRMAEAERSYVESYLEKALPADGLDPSEVPVRAVVLFTNPDVVLNLEDDPPLPALRAVELKRWLRKEPLRPRLSDEAMTEILEALNAGEGAAQEEG
ncbi:MAG: hypothetical protein ACP5JG_02320 [Anaerolineae bacterium]